MNPQSLLFSPTHEWVSISLQDDQRIATIGISAFAVEQLTDLVYIQLPEVGSQVQAGQPFGEIESVKAVSDLYSPVSGEIIEVNTSLADNLDLFSKDPYGAGWIIKVRLAKDEELRQLMDYDAYQRQCASEG